MMMNYTYVMRKPKLLNTLDNLITNLNALYGQTKISTWEIDENSFYGIRAEATNLLQKIYKGNAGHKIQDFNKKIDNGSAVIHSILPNGDRDTRNHSSIFKPSIKSAIGELTNYRIELSTTSLIKLRWTKKKWLAAIGSFIMVVTISLIKELPALISAFKNK